MEPGGVAPGAPVGAGHRKIPTAAHPQSPQPRDTEQLTSTGPSPHQLHHLDMHAIKHMEKSTHRDPVSWPLVCFALDLGWFSKSTAPKSPSWVLVLLAADSRLEKRMVLSQLLCCKPKPCR